MAARTDLQKYRQYALVGVFALMLLYFGGEWVWQNVVRQPIEERQSRGERLQREIEKRQLELKRIRKAAQELAVWQSQSLPSNPEIARSLYQAWLLELVGHVGLDNPAVEVREAAGRKGSYLVIAASIRGRGSLEQVTQLLYEFYRAGHLHQIRSLILTPLKEGRLDMTAEVEALVLPGADREDRLTTVPSDRLAGQRLEDYRVIAQRDLFGTGGLADPIEHTLLTAVSYVNGVPEAWFSVRSGDRLVKLSPGAAPSDALSADSEEPGETTLALGPGESFRVGHFTAKVLRIDEEDVILESEGRRLLLTIGESLAEAAVLPPEF